MGMYYWDPTYLLVIIGMLLCMGASAMVNSAMNRYSKVRNARGMTGAEAARQILNNEGRRPLRSPHQYRAAVRRQLQSRLRDGGGGGGP